MADAKGTSSFLIINPAAGSAPTLTESLTGAAFERGIGMRVLEPGEDARQAALKAADDGAESLAVAGGDGSVAAVAGVAVERNLPLVVVPTGTLNHFARDLGLDLARPLAALDVLTSGHHERRVDVGRVNGHTFINNVSLGLYAEMLADPGYRQDKLGVAQAKLQAAFSDPKLRGALRIAPPARLHSRASSPLSSRTTRTSSRGGTISANATAWTQGRCRFRCSMQARSRSSNG